MSKKRDGSALLIVLFATTGIISIGLACWYQMSLQNDVIMQREHYYKHFYLTSAVLDAGLVLVKDNFDAFMHKRVTTRLPIVLDYSFAVRDQLASYEYCTLEISKASDEIKEQALMLCARLYVHKKCCSVMRCVLIKKKGGEKKHVYVVAYFTIGNVL